MINQEKVQTPEEGFEYKGVVEQIKNLNWEGLGTEELQKLMYLSYASAREFAEALRIALKLYPDNKNLQLMAEGELNTSNLIFEGYKGPGDHADFLDYFMKKFDIAGSGELEAYTEAYKSACNSMEPNVRAMSIFSREEELSGIFRRILKARDWSAPGLQPFRYYLARHIALDADEGGHADLTKEFPVDDNVKPFYEARLEMYRAIPKLFEKS